MNVLVIPRECHRLAEDRALGQYTRHSMARYGMCAAKLATVYRYTSDHAVRVPSIKGMVRSP